MSPPLSRAVAVQVLVSALQAMEAETTGSRCGAYKLLEKLGEGGFGVVWLAEQEAPIRRMVALKIIKAGMDTEEVIARFGAERQALALMDHPNIARVFDAGVSEGGRPFVVMELVRGIAITRFCDEHKLGPELRLRLFAAVCQAVQHAHQKGIIHRDLKPSNILVTLDDGMPVPKVIDFGIAKAMGMRLTDKTLFTRFYGFMGTPAYTSPEQMEMSGLDVDTRSDIYSLGVLLYELLAGCPPFDPQWLAEAGLDAMRRTIREIDPPRPSQRLVTFSEEGRRTVAEQRGIEPAKLSLLLRGDLDWIVMRCLEKDRTRRYETASGLARDIDRYLANEPVAARPPTALYWLQKLVRRHKVGVAASTAVAVSIVGGLIASSALLVRERAARTRADAAEKQQSELRHQAELGRAEEEKRSARTALDLANRYLADGRVADGLAYLVYAARKDPHNRAIGPRIASVLASYDFAIPQALNSRVLALRYTHDGRSFFVGTEDGMFRVMDASTGLLKHQFDVGSKVVPGGWEFAQNNDTLVGARFPDNTLAVFDVATGNLRIPRIRLPPALGVIESQRVVGFSPSGRWIYATAHKDFWMWSAETGAVQLNLRFGEVMGLGDFSPAEDVLAIPAGDSVERWSLPSGQPIGPSIKFRHTKGSQFPYQVRFSPDGKKLAIAERGAAQVFDAATGAILHRLPELGELLEPPSLVFVGNDRLRLRAATHFLWWNLPDGRPATWPLSSLLDVSLDAEASRGVALSFDGRLRVLDVGQDTSIVEPAWRQSGGYSKALSADGAQVLLGTADGLLYRFNLKRSAARPLKLPRPMNPKLAAPFLPELPSRLLVLAGDHAKVIQIASGHEVAGGFRYPDPILEYPWADTLPTIRADLKFMVVRTPTHGWQSWELGPEGVKHVTPLSVDPLLDVPVTLSATRDVVAISHPDPTTVWDLRTGLAVGPPIESRIRVTAFSLSFSPDAKRLAVGAWDGSAFVVDVATGRQILSFDTARQVRVWAARFSPDGERLLTTNLDGDSRVWNAMTGAPLGQIGRDPGINENPFLFGKRAGTGQNPEFSPDGRWIALRNPKRVTLLDGHTGAPVGLPIPAGGNRVMFSPDGNRLATAESEGNAQVWEVPGGDAVTEPLRPGPLGSRHPEFGPDGRFLKTESDTHFYVWAVPPPLPEGSLTPEWLLELATLCSSQIVDDAGHLVPTVEPAANAEKLRRRIAALPAAAPLADWGRWILDERENRPIAPGFAVTPAEAEAIAHSTPSD